MPHRVENGANNNQEWVGTYSQNCGSQQYFNRLHPKGGGVLWTGSIYRDDLNLEFSKEIGGLQNVSSIKHGIINHGYDYEHFLPAFLALKFFHDTTIKNFTLRLNPSSYRKFDDLRIDIEDKDGWEMCYLFQLKHKDVENERQSALILERDDRFNLQKYLNSYNNITKNGRKITGILYTNIQFEQLDQLERYEMFSVSDDQLNFFNTSINGDGIFKFRDKTSNTIESFFDNFYLLSNQINVPNLKEAIKEIFAKQYGAGPETAIVYLDLFKELRQKQDSNSIVTKDEILKQLMGLLLKDSIIVGPTTTEHNESIDLIENVFAQFDITLLQECDNNLIPSHSQTEHIFENKPLFIRVSTQFKKKIISTIRLCRSTEFNIKFVLVGEGITREDLPEIASFQNLSDLEKRNQSVYKELASKSKLSLQGRKVASLEKLATTFNLDLKCFLTPNEIFSLIRGDLIIGDKLKPLPEPYIPRSLINEQQMEIKDGDITFDNQLNQICAKPGSGKTTLMKYLINSSPLDHWIVSVTAKECSGLFQNVCKVNKILKHLYYNGQDIKLQENLRDMKKIIFFFDGLDELNTEYQKNAFESIKNLVKAKFQVWMFFRCDLENVPKFDKSESDPNVRKYQIKDFDEKDIEEYIKQRLKNSNNTVEGLHAIENIMKNEKINLFKVPLYLYIITEIMIANKDFVQEIENEASLYNYFIKGKFKHFTSKTGRQFEEIWDEFEEYILEQYQIAALKSVLEPRLFKLLSISNNKKFIGRIKENGDNLGIVRKVDTICGNLVFEHHTYGEYLAASWLTENFDRVPVCQRNFILQEKYKSIKRFCDLIFDQHFPSDYVTLYCYAAAANRFDLIEKAIDQKVYEPEQLFKTFLWLAAADGFLKVLEHLLIKCEADIGIINENNETLLHVAARNGHLEVVKFLIKQKKELLEGRDLRGTTPLHLAAQMGHREIIECLHKNGANVNAVGVFKRTPLHYASYVGKVSAVKYLVNNSDKIDELDEDYRTPLHRAAQKGHKKIVACLLDKNANVYLKDKYKWTPLHFAADNNHLEIVEILVNKMDKIESTDEDGKTALDIATEKGHENIVKFLKDVKKNSPRKGGEPREHYRSPLHQATKDGDLEQVKRILDSGVHINTIDKDDLDKNTILHIAVINGHQQIVDFILERNAKTSIKNRDGRVPLHLAAQNGSISIVQSLIKKNKNDLKVTDKWKLLPLHLASYKGHIPIIILFLQNGVNVTSPGLKEGTALHSAAQGGRVETIDYLIDTGVDLEAKDGMKKTCLHLATQQGHVDAVNHLIKLRSSLLNETDAFGRTALHRAVEIRNFDLVKCLVEAGANIDIKNDNTHTPLDIAKITKQHRILEYLRQNQLKMLTA